jgi:subtilisin family serine protease
MQARPPASAATASCRHTDPDGYALGSGTSFATPIVAGLAATVWGALPAGTPWSRVAAILTASATTGRLTSLPEGTPNLLGACARAWPRSAQWG